MFRDDATALSSMRQLNESHEHCRMSDNVMYTQNRQGTKPPLDRIPVGENSLNQNVPTVAE